jgi:hypothetical protein
MALNTSILEVEDYLVPLRDSVTVEFQEPDE